ncbi:MAG: P1 family peptidase [Clostridia bacterium]|nr:P1 family peptidase [Clostridia bacterium]
MTKKRIADYGIRIGSGERGARNRITDVPGVKVGHATIRDARHRTGVTIILPCEDNPFPNKLTAASFVQNGFGKTVGLVQIDELGTLETPIALTNTLNTGLVADALVSVMAERCAAEHIPMRSINPVVGETNDSRLNDILDRAVHEEDVRRAIESAGEDFEEGDVGAGAGTVCHGLKGGIGSASRVLRIAGGVYTLGVLVQSNHGCLEELTIRGRRIGEEIMRAQNRRARQEPQDLGSIMMIVATDLPVSDRQLRRILKRCSVGLARCGSYLGHGSGDVMIGFSTANRMPAGGMHRVLQQQVLTEHSLEQAFFAVAEATEEAVLNSLVAAKPQTAEDGTRYDSLADYLSGGSYDLG